MIELSFPGDLTDAEELATRLASTGLGERSCRSRAALFAKAAAALAVAGTSDAGHAMSAFFVPGRIEVLGKHTDYAGGRTLSAAIERGLCVTALPRDDRQVVVIDASTGETLVFRTDSDSPWSGFWANDPMIVARRIAKNFPGAMRGADIAFLSDLPSDGGLGDSNALRIAVFLALCEINRLEARDEYWHNIGGKEDLARYLHAVEKGQTFGTLAGDASDGFLGNECHTTILCAEPGQIGQYSYGPIEFEKTLKMPSDHVFAIASSGVRAENTGEALERRAAPVKEAAAIVDLWQRATGSGDLHLAAALSSSPNAEERLISLIESSTGGLFSHESLRARLEHFMLESGEIIPAAGDALAGGDLRAFGRLAYRSQRGAENLLKNQTPETVFLAADARRLGAAAATSFGFGFGGSVWALVEESESDDFLAAWAERYSTEFPQWAGQSQFFLTSPGPAAFRVC